MILFTALAVAITTVVSDPSSDTGFDFPGFFSMNWDRIGGWSLFIGLCILIVVGAFREWWVPGARYRRLEASAEKQSTTLADATVALREQTQANEITKHFFEKTVPTRGGRQDD